MIPELLEPSALSSSAVFAVIFWRRQQRLRGRGPGQLRFPLLLEYTMGLCILLILHQAALAPNVGTSIRGGGVSPQSQSVESDPEVRQGIRQVIRQNMPTASNLGYERPSTPIGSGATLTGGAACPKARENKKPDEQIYLVYFENRQMNLSLREIRKMIPHFQRFGAKDDKESMSILDIKRKLREEAVRQGKFTMIYGGNEVRLCEHMDHIMKVRKSLEDRTCKDGIPVVDTTRDGKCVTTTKEGVKEVMTRDEGRRLQLIARSLKDGILIKNGSDDKATRMPVLKLMTEYYGPGLILKNYKGEGVCAVTSRKLKEIEADTPQIFFPEEKVWKFATHDLLDELSGGPPDPPPPGGMKTEKK